MELRGRVAVVTGGASGIGAGIARAFARRGATVVIADIDETRTARAVEELSALGTRVLGVRCDVTSDTDVQALADHVADELGPADVVVNNAGVAMVAPATHLVSLDEWRAALDINLLSVVRGVNAFVPAMLQRGSGWVVNTASIAGFYVNADHQTVYSATKYAVRGLTDGLRMSLEPRGVGVSCLAPNAVATNIGDSVRLLGSDDWSVVRPPEGLRSISADEAGEATAEAVEAGRYLIVTHPEEREEIRRRYGDDLGDEVLPAPARGA
jgi:NAD(P)-dependent dehydrogenase (short-subunit alcohol dehydrogenase family)